MVPPPPYPTNQWGQVTAFPCPSRRDSTLRPFNILNTLNWYLDTYLPSGTSKNLPVLYWVTNLGQEIPALHGNLCVTDVRIVHSLHTYIRTCMYPCMDCWLVSRWPTSLVTTSVHINGQRFIVHLKYTMYSKYLSTYIYILLGCTSKSSRIHGQRSTCSSGAHMTPYFPFFSVFLFWASMNLISLV